MRLPDRMRLTVGAFRAAGASDALRLVQIARLASVTGRWAYTVTLAVFAYRHGGAGGVALAGLVRLGPAAVASPFAGALLGRVSVGAVLVDAGLLRTLALGGAATVALADGPLWVLYSCIAVESAVSAVLRPVQNALVPPLARTPAELTSANLVLSVFESAGVLVGPLCGALLLQNTSVGVVFLAAAGTYLVSALLLVPVSVGLSRTETRAAPARGRFFGEAMAGLRTVGSDADTRVVLGLYAAQNLVAGALNVLIVVAALRLLGLGQSGVGTLTAAVGIGGVIGGGLALTGLRGRRYGVDLAVGLLLWGIPLVLLALVSSELVALALLAVVGVGVTVVDVAAVTLLQRAASDQLLAHALGLLQATLVITVGVGTLLAPVLLAEVGVRGALLVAGLPLPVLAGGFWRRLRRLDAAAPPVSRWLPLLEAHAIFAPLAAAPREHLAAHLSEEHVLAGETRVRTGSRRRCLCPPRSAIGSRAMSELRAFDWPRRLTPGRVFKRMLLPTFEEATDVLGVEGQLR